jgi:hypothetical protein
VNPTQNQKRISFKDLPTRARKLHSSEISAVFGGAQESSGAPCSKDSECASNQCVIKDAVPMRGGLWYQIVYIRQCS